MENLIWFYRSYGRLSCVRVRRCSQQQQQQVRRRSCPRPLAVDPGPFLGFVSKPWQRTAGLRRTSPALGTGRFAVIYRTVATSLRYLAAKQKGATPQVPRGEGTDQLGGSDVKRLFELAKPERWKLAGAVGLLLMSSMVTMSVPFCMGKVIDIIYTHAQEGSMVEKLNSISQVLVIVFLMGGLANAGRVYLMQITGQNIIASLRKKLYSSILRQEIGFFDKTKTGELISRLAADAAVVGHSITMNISDGLRALAQAVGGVGMMLYVSPKLAGIALGIVPPVAAFSVLYGRYLRNITRRMQDSVADSTEIADERISNMRIVRAFVQEDKEYLTYSDKIRHMLKLAYKEAFARGLFFGFTGFSGNLIILSVFYYGGLMMAKSQLTIGELSSFILYAAYVGISMGGLSSFYSELMRGIGASSRLWKLIDRQPLIPVQGGQDLPQTIHGNIEFRDVLFSYPARKDVDVLSCFNLSVPAGSVTAVVGASGSGKSTLTALLLRYYDPTAGHVMLDGIDIKTVNPSQLRGCIGMVSQEPVLLSCSIAENIAYGSQDPSSVTMDVIEDSARKSNAYDFIQKFPNGFNTLVGERGVMLSGGQKQRIAIARALIKNPQILLLDEATSALDAESEALIQEALERVMEGRTVITIAHRLSTIKKADLIAVIHNKSVVELGTYMELMQITDGMFKKLVERQTITS